MGRRVARANLAPHPCFPTLPAGTVQCGATCIDPKTQCCTANLSLGKLCGTDNPICLGDGQSCVQSCPGEWAFQGWLRDQKTQCPTRARMLGHGGGGSEFLPFFCFFIRTAALPSRPCRRQPH